MACKSWHNTPIIAGLSPFFFLDQFRVFVGNYRLIHVCNIGHLVGRGKAKYQGLNYKGSDRERVFEGMGMSMHMR